MLCLAKEKEKRERMGEGEKGGDRKTEKTEVGGGAEERKNIFGNVV